MKNSGNEYSWQAMLIVTILMACGAGIIYLTTISGINNFYSYLAQYGVLLIISTFFILVGLYCWLLYLINVIGKQKKTILYLLEIVD